MPIKLKRELLELFKKRYHNAGHRAEKTRIITDFCFDTGYTRKYAIRILKGRIQLKKASKPGPKSKYQSSSLIIHLARLWDHMNRMCSKKMVVALPLWLNYYKGCTDEEKTLLLNMSSSTIDRLLNPYKSNQGNLRGLSSTKPSLLANKILIKLLDAEIKEPGYMEADTVVHCGSSLIGEYVHSLTMTDLFSGWTENRACWTKSSENIQAKIKNVESLLPFKLKGFASDNGSEFITHNLHDYFMKRDEPVEFVRRRAYKKNDNAHVEQKNFTHVREIFGYQRFENKELVNLMNEIYKAYWNPLWNYFTPVMKLVEKTRVNSKYVKKYDKPQTPYQRLLASEHLTLKQKQNLKDRFEGHNPFYLKQELEIKLKVFFEKVEQYKKEKLDVGS